MKKEYLKPEVEEMYLDLESSVCVNDSDNMPEEGGGIEGELPDGEKWD